MWEAASKYVGYCLSKDQGAAKRGGVLRRLGIHMDSLVAQSVDSHCNGSAGKGRGPTPCLGLNQAILEGQEVPRGVLH